MRATKQSVIRRGTRSNPTARRLIASSATPAPSVLRSTVELDFDIPAILHKQAKITAWIAGQRILKGQDFYLVASPKFGDRFYVLVRTIRGWECSSADEQIKQYCIAQVEAYRASVLVAA